jgi:hypothetical protein
MIRKTVVCLVALAAGCGNDDAKAPGGNTGAQTTWDDVAPVLYGKCVRCHQEGGIGPFRLDTYESARVKGPLAAAAVTQGKMPPYYLEHDGTCGDFEQSDTLSPAEKQTIVAWAEGGMRAGTKPLPALPPRPGLEGFELATPPFAPKALGTRYAQHDDYRCFALDVGQASTSFITGYDVLPGNPALVHHVIGFVVDPDKTGAMGKTNAEIMKALDDKSPDIIGWDCFGGAGDGVDAEAAPVDWAPGQGVVLYPAGMGVEVGPKTKLVVQIHYNLADPALDGMMDSTKIHLRFAPQVERRLQFLFPDGFLDTLFTGGSKKPPDSLPAGRASYQYSWMKTGKDLGVSDPIPDVDLIAVMPHMHQRGKSLELRIGSAANDMACAARTERWDFHWQKMYFYKTRPRLTATSALQVTCDFDTTADHDPVLPGWGTGNEMCLALMMVALPPGM